MKLQFKVMKYGIIMSLVLAFSSGVLLLLKSPFGDIMLFSLGMVLIFLTIYWLMFLRCPSCKKLLFNQKKCDHCGSNPLE